MGELLQNIIVFCGSSFGHDNKYQQLAAGLGEGLAVRGLKLIYGGASCGLMGVIADNSLKNNGSVSGYIPHSLIDLEVAHRGLSELHETNCMHERKAKMYEAGDMALVLPGGSGSMDEFFEFLVWNKLNIHRKPLVLFNAHGYYDLLLQFMHKMKDEGFMHENDFKLFSVVNDLEEFWTFLGS
jgi:hypothetical protein